MESVEPASHSIPKVHLATTLPLSMLSLSPALEAIPYGAGTAMDS